MKAGWLAGGALALCAVHCATGEDDPQRKKPGGYVDGGNDAGGAGGSGGSAGSTPTDAGDASDAIADAGTDVVDAADATAEAGDATPDATEAGPTGTLLMIARSASQITFGATTGGAWTTQDVVRATLSTPAIATSASDAVAVVRDQTGNALSFSSWNPQSGAWSSFGAVAAAGATIGSPALATSGNVHLAFLGTDNKLYSNVYAPGTGFQPSFTNVEALGVHSFGPSAPALAASSSGVVLAQEGNDGDLYLQRWQGSWQSASSLGLLVKVKPATPPAATSRAGNVIVAYVETGTSRLMWTESSGTGWTSPIPVHALAFSPSTPALVGLANGSVVLAFRALDDKVYATTMSGSSFGAPVLVHPSLGTTASPAIAPGIAGRVAELAWVSGGSVQTSSLGSAGWSGPIAVAASGQQAVALATYLP